MFVVGAAVVVGVDGDGNSDAVNFDSDSRMVGKRGRSISGCNDGGCDDSGNGVG